MNLFSAWDLPWPVLQIPEYREMTLGGWRLKKFELIPQRGYFQDWHGEGEMFALLEGEKAWMSTAWDEVDSQAPHVAAGGGHVVLMGAGMGVALFNLLAKPEVQQVTLVEREPLVLDILEQSTGMSSWRGIEKLHVALVDALEFSPEGPVDHLYVDIWPTIGEGQNVEEMQAIQRRVRASSVGWWGQEIHYLEWLKRQGNEPSLSSYQTWADELGLPLIERANPAYIAGIVQVSKSYIYKSFLADPQRGGKAFWSEATLENWTHAAFSKQIHTTFGLTHPECGNIPLELVSVSELRETARQRMYSILFRGPLELPFQQGSFPLAHEVMGEATLFLVPVAREADGFRYEAVFNQLVK
ncbi:MAG: hypothetical protein EHM33_11405 [Chloroflexi bacterium]|nr:MAG: hypothetical protein EHM33_11405 [Chloroflexota bacterium]